MTMDPEILEALRRNSGLRLDSEGQFHLRDRIVENTRVQTFFHERLTVRPDGEVILTVGSQWAYVACDTVARFVESLSNDAEWLHVRFRHGAQEVSASPRLGFGPDNRCYLWLASDSSPAVLLRAAHQSLVSVLEARGDQLVLPMKAGDLPVAILPAVPSPDSRWL